MEVVYIYMKDYLGLKEKEYNFHENYKFSFDKNLKEISMKETEIKIPENFFGEKINSINAIIGENGKGKTRILNFIYEYYSGDRVWKKFKKNEIFKIQKLMNKDLECDNILILKGRKDYFYIMSNLLEVSKKQMLSKTKIFYYSNIFDYNGGINGCKKYQNELRDLSITQEYLEMDYVEKELNLIFNNIKIQNDIRQINMIKELKNNYKEFYKILKSEIYFSENINLNLIKNNNTKIDDELNKDFIKEEKKLSTNFSIEGAKKLYKRLFIINLWGIMTREILDLEKEKKLEDEVIDILEDIDSILNLAKIKKEKGEICIFINIEHVYKLLEVLNKVKEKMKNSNLFCGIELRKIPSGMNRILDYTWEIPMSSGEKGMLRLFSSLHEVLEKNEQLENLILLIDELDATFHPEWQRKALDLLVKYLNNYSKYIKSNLTSQLIISSHSPFLIADLPKEKIIALDNDGNQKENNELTAFGSNILDIYKENFFLTSTFGEFAKGKITNVIELLSKGETEYTKLSENKKNEIKFIINSVGEPLIKNKLKKMYLELKRENQIQEIKRIMKEKGIELEDLREEEIQ